MNIYWLCTLLLAALPIIELRGAIPLAIFAWGIDPVSAAIIGIIGSFLPVIPGILFLKFLSGWLSDRFYVLNRFFAWLFEHTQKKHGGTFNEFRDLALFIIAAIPLPLMGAYSGALVAFVFGVPIKRASALIFAGTVVSGIIITVLCLIAPDVINSIR